MEVRRRYSDRMNVYDYYLHKEGQTLSIMFCGNLDLYWSLRIDKEAMPEDYMSEIKTKFIIDKENYNIYSLFDQLYEDVRMAKIFDEDRMNDRCSDYSCYPYLFDGNKIEWHSDEECYDLGDRFIITKHEDSFEIEFIRPALNDGKMTYRLPNHVTIRIRNSGSHYNPFNIIFMRMFNRLQEYDPDNHQLHFDEELYHKKRTLKKTIKEKYD